MELKYRMTNKRIIIGTRILYRIEALRDFGNVHKGDEGGFIESEENLSHEGLSWVHTSGQVYGGKGRVHGDGQVYGKVCDGQVYGKGRVHGRVYGGKVSDNGKVEVYGLVYGNVSGNGMAYGVVYSNETINC